MISQLKKGPIDLNGDALGSTPDKNQADNESKSEAT